jgi:hypothetical protein
MHALSRITLPRPWAKLDREAPPWRRREAPPQEAGGGGAKTRGNVPPEPALPALPETRRASYEPRSPCYAIPKQPQSGRRIGPQTSSAKWRPRRDDGEWSVRSHGRHPSMPQPGRRPETSPSQRHIDKATGRAALLAKSFDATSHGLSSTLVARALLTPGNVLHSGSDHTPPTDSASFPESPPQSASDMFRCRPVTTDGRKERGAQGTTGVSSLSKSARWFFENRSLKKNSVETRALRLMDKGTVSWVCDRLKAEA